MLKYWFGLAAIVVLMTARMAFASDGSEAPTINALPLAVVVGFIGKYATDLARGIWNLLPKKWGLKIEGKGVLVLAGAICVLGAFLWCQIPGVTADFGFWPAIEAAFIAVGFHEVTKK